MKLTIACLIAASAVIQQIDGRAIEDKFSPEETCVREQHLDIHKARQQTQDIVTQEENETYGKFFLCVWRKRGVMDEEGNIDANAFRRFLEVLTGRLDDVDPIILARVNYVMKRCSSISGNTRGRTAIKLKNCMNELPSDAS